MIVTDLHLHSSHSGDCKEPMEAVAESAIELGLKEICFTEHYDMDYPQEEDCDFTLDTDEYLKHFKSCKKSFEGRIKLLFGVELGLQPHLAESLRDYSASYPFDFIIGSSHLANGKDPYLPSYFWGRSEREAYLEYFESILECVNCFDDFDVYGHLDYVVRYGPNKDKYYSYGAYAEVLDEILKKLIEKGKGIEVNSGGFAHGLDHPNPRQEILKRYRELGGEILTTGSDAHSAGRVGYRFGDLEELIKGAGFEYITVFENRRPRFLRLG